MYVVGSPICKCHFREVLYTVCLIIESLGLKVNYIIKYLESTVFQFSGSIYCMFYSSQPPPVDPRSLCSQRNASRWPSSFRSHSHAATSQFRSESTSLSFVAVAVDDEYAGDFKPWGKDSWIDRGGLGGL